MAFSDVHKEDGGKHRGIIPLSTTGIFVFNVSRGRTYNLVVDNPGGATIDLVHYNFSEEDDNRDNQTRILALDEVGLTDLKISRFTAIGVYAIGIQVTTAVATPIVMELVECDL